MASYLVKLDRVTLGEDESFQVHLPDNRAVEIYSDGTVQLWSPSERLAEFDLSQIKGDS